MRQDSRSRPIMPTEAKAGRRPRTCMHVHAPRPEAEGHVNACPRPSKMTAHEQNVNSSMCPKLPQI
eukprot:293533-Chlamydomonas_euryale.AAC.6